VIDVLLTTVSLAGGFEPKSTAVAPLKPDPVIVTSVPPPSEPAAGLMPVTVGAATYENTAVGEAAEVPVDVVTVTPTIPTPAGLEAAIVVGLKTLNVVAWFPPKLTAVAPAKPAPVIVTNVPPVSGPALGLTLETVGA
jgi:hypothetical protein